MTKYKVLYSTLIFLFWAALPVSAQKNDYIWLQGYDSNQGYDANLGLYFGNPVMDFNYLPVKITRDSLPLNITWTNTSYCDNNGNLLLYTNGICVANSYHDTIENGDSLNWGFWLQYVDNAHGSEGYLVKEGIYILQSLADSNQYYIIHTEIDSDGTGAMALLYTLVDMSLNGGRGKVLAKNQPIITGQLRAPFGITRHGNGRDWWIVAQKMYSNCYYRILFDAAGFHVLPDTICLGNSCASADVDGPVKFSVDGGKLIFISLPSGLNIFDFDRCTGEISNPVTVNYPDLLDTNAVGGGAATSPDSRYLYVCLTYYVFQYDLWAADIPGSVDTVGIYNYYPAPISSDFYCAQNGPDGKIYISCGNGDTVYNVINNPNAKGDSSNCVEHAIQLPSPSCGVPSFPNYRLGALRGSQCDSLSGLNEVQRAAKEKILKIYPNPAADYAIIDYGFTDWSKGEVQLQISNALGQTMPIGRQAVYTQQLPMYSGFQKIDISNFASGMYTVFIKRNNAVVASGKVVKE